MKVITQAMVATTAIILAGCASDSSLSRVDQNQDDAVSFKEFDSYMKDEIFRNVDTNGDGKVSQAEWRAANPKDPLSEFQRVDRNRDGFISRKEADRDFDKQGSLKKLFKKMDTDGNNSLSRMEIEDFQRKMRAARGSSDLEKLSNAAES